MAACSLQLSGVGARKIGRVKLRKFMSWDNNSLIGKEKAVHMKQSKTGNSFTDSHGQAGVQPSPREQGNSDFERQTPVTLNISHFPQLYCWAQCSMVWNVSVGQLGSAFSAVSPANFLCTTQPPHQWHRWGATKALCLSQHCSAVAKISLC